MVETPGFQPGGTGTQTTVSRDQQDWINKLSNDQIVPVGKALLTRIADNPTLRDHFIQQAKGDPTLSRMLGGVLSDT